MLRRLSREYTEWCPSSTEELYEAANFTSHCGAHGSFHCLGVREHLLLLCLPRDRLRGSAAPRRDGGYFRRGGRDGRQAGAPCQRQLPILRRGQSPRDADRFHWAFSHHKAPERQLRPARHCERSFFRVEEKRGRVQLARNQSHVALDLLERAKHSCKTGRGKEIKGTKGNPIA